MHTVKRLFLFAGYDQDGIIDDALIYYVSQLKKFGDIVLCMDSDCKKSEIDKIKKYCLHVIATRHGEYDFGSYKRAYTWAHDKGILNNYDILYLVNDSVFGPVLDIKNTLQKIEDINSDTAGLVVSVHKTHSYMESWFVRLNHNIFTAKWFYEFISAVSHESRKSTITIKYEHGLSKLIKRNNCTWNGVYRIWGRYTYNHPKRLFQNGCPFIKRASFIRHNGGIGNQVKYILSHCDTRAAMAILKTANRIYGNEYMNWLMTYNPIKIWWRKIKYAKQKISRGWKW